jgi:hypothetical protein
VESSSEEVPESSKMKRTKDIVKSFESLIKDHAMWLIYVRRDMRFTCPCFNTRTKQGDPNHAECFGTGRKITIEKIPSRVVFNPMQTRAEGEANYSAGWMGFFSAHIYTARNTYPKLGDYYLESEWTGSWENIAHSGWPININQAWEVKVVSNQQIGPITFWESACEIYMQDFTRFNEHFRTMKDLITILPETWK